MTAAVSAMFFLFPAVGSAKTDMGKRDTPDKRLGLGDHKCSIGSYKARKCSLTVDKGVYTLTAPTDLGHNIPFTAQIMGTDQANQLLLMGTPLSPNRICGEEEGPQCPDQPLIVVLRKRKNGTWRGKINYWILRTDKAGPYKHGVVTTFTIR